MKGIRKMNKVLLKVRVRDKNIGVPTVCAICVSLSWPFNLHAIPQHHLSLFSYFLSSQQSTAIIASTLFPYPTTFSLSSSLLYNFLYLYVWNAREENNMRSQNVKNKRKARSI